MKYSEAKIIFDSKYKRAQEYVCFLPEHLTLNKTTSFLKKDGSHNEQYYKWQFLYSIVNSGLFPKDLIGTEIRFPKGNKSSSDIIIDAAIFSESSWYDKYKDYHQNNNSESLDWLRKHLIVAIEFKKEDNKNVTEVWDKQLKAYMKESEADFCLGVLYDTERLYLFRKYNGKYLRYSDEYNVKGEKSGLKDLSLNLPDPYRNIPSYERIVNWANAKETDYSIRSINDLDIISGIQSTQINDAMSAILRTMDKLGMVNQKGFEVLVQILSLKIYDEKRNEKQPTRYLDFYVKPEERSFNTLADSGIQTFLNRISKLKEEASGTYYRILQGDLFNIKDEKLVRILIEVVKQFQDYSFVNSQKTDLYQLVFYKFAGQFSKDQNAQFVTPLPLIEFLVDIVNPRNGETVIDPTVGIADFLSVSYVNSNSKLDDKNIFGMDIDDQMVMLATLNMLLNGDGNAKIIAQTDGYGSLLTKFGSTGEPIQLIPSMNQNGDWEKRPDTNKIKKFDVVLTNPPFGEDRAYTPKDQKDLDVIKCYELWKLYGQREETNETKKKKTKAKEANKIDLGIVFLENAYRILAENGRMGIVLSNSIASIDSHRVARQWLMEKMRIVALFDMPANVFAETGVNTTIIVAYKPSNAELNRLKEQNYEIFIRDIKKVGYEVKTSKRVKYFSPSFKINYDTFETEIDSEGNPVLDEDFTQTIKDFRQWCLQQEKSLQDLFIKEK
ncbi:N-6 DNA methylase [Prevotella communis]|uniref:HsdM family class I SAM-dependent methyltransferase n=1 Tax=Prevotella communis TaxID=2913614 RepID=UPI001EDB7BD0|nr:N-6 DNA methylase [Prevotella communis]UKK63312.1 N-6 DNA methylase [Prevotella communis]UKK66137.1 N-6 DNA methylase [Prevotella communis]